VARVGQLERAAFADADGQERGEVRRHCCGAEDAVGPAPGGRRAGPSRRPGSGRSPRAGSTACRRRTPLAGNVPDDQQRVGAPGRADDLAEVPDTGPQARSTRPASVAEDHAGIRQEPALDSCPPPRGSLSRSRRGLSERSPVQNRTSGSASSTPGSMGSWHVSHRPHVPVVMRSRPRPLRREVWRARRQPRFRR